MLHEITKHQLSKLTLAEHRPLVICDVDEVIVHFTRDFETYLHAADLFLDTTDLQMLHAGVRKISDKKRVHQRETMELVQDFFAKRTRNMEAIDGAVEGMLEISRHAEVVMLTNLPHEAGDDRRDNLADLGLNFPVITNSGPKGPAIHHLASRVNAPVVFIDDSPSFISSAYEHAPHVHLVHFLHDPRFLKNVVSLDFVSLRTDRWADLLPHVLTLIARSPALN
jgi:hypothetical protein